MSKSIIVIAGNGLELKESQKAKQMFNMSNSFLIIVLELPKIIVWPLFHNIFPQYRWPDHNGSTSCLSRLAATSQ